MIEIEDSEAIELYNKLKQFILNSKDYEYSEQDDKEEGKVTFINKKGDEITVGIKCYQSSYDYKKTYIAYILTPNHYVGGYHTIWKLDKDSREVEYGYGWDCDEYYVVPSREIPEDILKPFRKKKHRPKKPTHKVYVEYSIVDDRSIIDELTEAYKRYYSATQKQEEISKEKERKIKEAIEKVTAQYKKEIDKRSLKVKNTKTKLEEYDSLITKYSTFDVDLIGGAIVRIINEISDKKLLYKTAIDKYQKRDHGWIDGWDEIFKREVKIIVDSNKAQNIYDNSDAYDYKKYISQIDQLVEEGYVILLSKGDSAITLLTSKNSEISFNINFGDYEYIKDFIMELVQYRFQRKIDKFTKDDMNLCVERFIEKSEKIKIQNRIIVLKKELDTLNSKLDS